MGGIEVFAYEIGKRLVSRGVRVSVVCSREQHLPRLETVEGIEVYRILALQNRYTLKLSMMPGLLRVVRNIEPTILHTNDATSSMISWFHPGNARTVVSVHGLGFTKEDWPTPFRQGIRLFQSLSVAKADKVVATDIITARAFASIRKNVSVIPAGVDTEVFQRGKYPRPEVMKTDKRNLLFVGRLNRVKGIDLLLRALPLIEEEYKHGIRLIVIGEGPMEDLVRNQAESPPEIVWLGRLAHSQVTPYYANADMFVLPSRSEGVPISLLEAMSSRTPIVSTMVGGVKSLLDERYATLASDVSPEAIAQAISRTLREESVTERRVAAARDFVEGRFSWDAIVDKYVRVYEELEGTSC